MLLDYRYLFVAWSDNLLVFSCEDIACTGDTPIFATGNNPIVFVDDRTWDKKETEMTNVRWKVFCFGRLENPEFGIRNFIKKDKKIN